ncbi:arylsulfatase [Paludisphaera rhizosphaerae]|uniref:arylsulfatase n=1 Tax=Paludisphaera rhizosphaerae TaxID=2711216 RepID=UPI0013ECB61A|nr:arylsulfatase [Paludisphaera rhizosphaerae]
MNDHRPIASRVRLALRLLTTATALAVAAGAPPAGLARDGKPNVVFILADDLGRGDLGCYGQQKIRTPNVDRMAAEGMRFTRFYAGSPVCAPARCTLLTGKHTGHAFVRDNSEVQPEGQGPIPDSEVTLAEMFKAQGYTTAAIGKWGLGFPGSEGDPLRQGFDHFYGYNCQRHAHFHYPSYLWKDGQKITIPGNRDDGTGEVHSNDLFEAEALRFIEAEKGRPFFLFLPLTLIHASLQVPADSLAEYAGAFPETPYQGTHYKSHPTPRAAQAAMVTRLDRTVGRVLEKLRQCGLDDDTLVIFSSDNGPTRNEGGGDSPFFNSAGGLKGFKGSVYEGGIAVPLLVRWPGRVKPGSTCDFIGYFPDVPSTLMEIIGAPAPVGTDGFSFAPSLLGSSSPQPVHDLLYWEFASYGGQQAVRMGPWKAVRQNLSKGPAKTELYNLDDDPTESHDLAAGRPDATAYFEAVMKREHVPSPQFPLPSVDPR